MSKSRVLVLCFDGTAAQYNDSNTNVVNFYSLLKRNSTEEQLCYYQAGIGTYFSPGVVSPFFTWVAKLLDDAVAWYLDAHVQDGYRFLMKNYCVGDKICLFGFSRGAYTARALAGMLHKVGLLSKDNDEQVNFAYDLYTRTDKRGIAMSAGFKRTFSRSVKIEFMGVWDTVESVGLFMGRSLPFTDSNSAIKTFRHVLSLDEHRAKFRPNEYHLRCTSRDPTITPSSGSSNGKKLRRLAFTSKLKMRNASKDNHSQVDLDTSVESTNPNEQQLTDVLEVWFAGCHADVGGSAVPDSTQHSLSHISLRWMIHQVVASKCGVLFDEEVLVRKSMVPLGFPDIAPLKDDSDEADSDEVDAVQPIHDELKSNPLWWLPELLPLHYSHQDAQGIWRKTFGFNLGRGRNIVDPHPKFHFTVKDRMNDPTLLYRPKALYSPGSEVYVQ